MGYNFTPFLRQMELEQRMRGLGFERVKLDNERAREDERESDTAYGHPLLLSVVDPLTAQIITYLADAFAGKPGYKIVTAARLLKTLDPSAVAYLATKTVLDALSANKMEQDVAVQIGRAIEEEARFREYRKQKPALFDVIVRDQEDRKQSKRHIKRVVVNRLVKAGGEWVDWTVGECMSVGQQLISFLLKLDVQIIERGEMKVRRKRKFKAAKKLMFGPGIKEFITERSNLTALLTPGFLPTVVSPKPWHTPFGGAYWTDMVDKRTKRLVKTRNMNYMEDLRHVQMPVVYDAINAVQETGWQINERVLSVLRECWRVERPVGKLVSNEELKLPTKPLVKPPAKTVGSWEDYKEWGKTEDGKAWRAWRRLAHTAHDENAQRRSKRVQIGKVLWIAGEIFKAGETIYFPHQLDFRSRMYAMPMFLHPQGPDYVRGLLRFAEGKPIANPQAKNWLAIHGANCYGIDKVSFHERMDWVRKNHERILSAAFDPMGTVGWWGEAENPWQFLAFCFEWSDFQKVGVLVSHLPVSLDGTCNGLQHFSAMLRDPVGGVAVNLMSADEPQDIYGLVASRVREYLSTDDNPFAPLWLAFGVDRKLCKRPVMILPYGGTQFACRKYVERFVLEKMAGKIEANPFGNDLMSAVVYLSKFIWEAIGETVIAAKTAMQWLRENARVMSKAQLAIVWQTPAGFPVRQAYPEMRKAELDLIIDGTRLRRRISIETDGLDRQRQVNGLSPNFVHSLDASALMETVRRCRVKRLRSFAMVHDSYGTLAADTQLLTEVLRGAFVEMYQEHDVLAEIRAAMVEAVGEIAPIPEKGALDIREVLRSRFFFA